MLSTLRKIVEKHEANFNPNDIRNVIDSYIKERKDRKAKSDPTAKFFTNESLVSSLVQFVGDGALTVSIFIGGFLQSLVQNPECQEKMYQEIAEVLGTERLPIMDDKSSLPYVNAFLQEVIRCSEFFPMFPSLQCTKETTVMGYRIPKGAITILNSWSANHDPLVYDDPYKFDPSRFITRPGKQRSETPIIFGIGKRSCAGEAFTMMQAFLFLTATVQNFKVCPAEGSATKASIFYEPEDMKLILKPRHLK
ncbi:cytochrome P450 1A1-like [Uloborus diversus]|uniref:cytochrome P450 1A1-like n=1 Tax=Uloborus diversus TaxID=327109 RepID=UPI002409D4D2|nr:cytochrome P450 1A1-like [Uloborus diversus]